MSKTKRQRKLNFLKRNKYCCFCGGKTLATEPDHIPSRALFKARQWPEDFEFPACHACNDATRIEELIVSAISRVYPDPKTDSDLNEFLEALDGISNNAPGVLKELKPSTRKIRQTLRKYGEKKDPNKFAHDYPFLQLSGPVVTRAVHQFSRKLFLALYYRHALAPLPPEGSIAVTWFSNLQIQDNAIPSALSQLLRRHPPLKRGNLSVDDQFFY